jgi:hypothetical protein
LQKKARETHLDRLVLPDSCRNWLGSLAHLPRYLNGIARRFQKYPENPDRDGRNGAIIDAWHQRWMEQVGRRQGGSGAGWTAGFPVVDRGVGGGAFRPGTQDTVPGVS